MSSGTVKVKSANPLKDLLAPIVIFGSIIVGYLIWALIMGDGSHFEGGNNANHPIAGDYFGVVYKGGMLVGTAIGLLLITVVLSIERTITLSRAAGKGSMDVFVQRLQIHLENNDVNAAIAECDKQKGTVGNVAREAIVKYKAMSEEAKKNAGTPTDKEQRTIAIQKSLEEATALELPVLQKHLVVISTIVSVATLLGLIGTVLGMIKAFSALATSGAPDAVALANGISEALINTALGISTSTIATVMYNYFTSQIDEMTYRIDEAGFSIVQTFNEKH
jgi:biopolymer transport protein ExbB